MFATVHVILSHTTDPGAIYNNKPHQPGGMLPNNTGWWWLGRQWCQILRFTCPITWQFGALASCREAWWVVVCIVKNWATLSGFYPFCLSSFESHPKINLNGFYGNNDHLIDWKMKYWMFTCVSLIWAPNHWYFHFLWKPFAVKVNQCYNTEFVQYV